VKAELTEEFTERAAVFRRELLAFCYRMLGSAEDAEEVVQETYLSAWRSYDTFEGRSSLRTWLYRIASRACLKALDAAKRRPLPSGIAGPSADPDGEVARSSEATWLQPFPSDPASIVETRATMRLALVAAFQHLPPRQRAVLILRDVLQCRAGEVAGLLDMSATAVNSALQRAQLPVVPDCLTGMSPRSRPPTSTASLWPWPRTSAGRCRRSPPGSPAATPSPLSSQAGNA